MKLRWMKKKYERREKTMSQQPEYQKVSLTTLNNGAAVELFQEEFEKVMRNINDVSVESDSVREIVLKVKIKPSKDRSSAATLIQASSKLVSTAEHKSAIMISPTSAYVTNYKQMDLDFKNQQSPE